MNKLIKAAIKSEVDPKVLSAELAKDSMKLLGSFEYLGAKVLFEAREDESEFQVTTHDINEDPEIHVTQVLGEARDWFETATSNVIGRTSRSSVECYMQSGHP